MSDDHTRRIRDEQTRRVSGATDDDGTRRIDPTDHGADPEATQALRRGDTQPGGRRMLGERYELRGLLGQGGMADVELAYDTQLDRQVAIKILHARYADDPSFLTRFRREAQHAAQLNHPNIVAVYDTGAHDGRPFIVMEYVSGRSLKELLAREGVLPERAAEIAGDAALALHYAHERGLVHRDIKPANIMVSDEGQVKVADFGIARAVNAETVTQTAAVFGTAAYIAPEQAQGEPVDRRTDVYALGCVLYELLTRRQPFQGESAVALAYQHISNQPTAPSEYAPDLSPELEAVVLRAMAKDPDDRYATARDMNADLQRAVAGLPVAAPPVYAYEQTAAIDRTEAVPAYEDYYEEEPYYDEPRRPWGMYLLLGLLLLAVLVVGGFLAAQLMGQQEEPPPQVTIPNVVGMHFSEAQRELTALGLRVGFDDEPVLTDEVPEDHVARTEPPVGEQVDQDSEVVLFIAGGPPMVAVPPTAGLPEEEAQQAIRDANLSIGERRQEPSEEFDEGIVIRSEPQEGEEIPEGAEVALVVSTGPPPLTVPDVFNLTEEAARDRLQNFCGEPPCFEVTASYEFHDEVAEGRVIRQDPAPNEELPRGATVALVVSRGPEEEPTPEPTQEPPPPPEPTPTPPPTPTLIPTEGVGG